MNNSDSNRLFELNTPNIENYRVNQEKRERRVMLRYSMGTLDQKTTDWKINLQNWLLKILTKKGYLSVYTVSREPNPKEVPQIRSRNLKNTLDLNFCYISETEAL